MTVKLERAPMTPVRPSLTRTLVLSLMLVLLAAAFLAGPARAGTILFDATKHEMAGNADWVIDSDI